MQLHELTSTNTKKAKRVGRGGKRGKTSGRGHKGQKARAGHHIRPDIRDQIKKLPKQRGEGKNRSRTINDAAYTPIGVNVSRLEAAFDAGATVTPSTLVSKQLVSRRGGRTPLVKILGSGELTKKLTVTGCQASASAKEKIEKAGGSVA